MYPTVEDVIRIRLMVCAFLRVAGLLILLVGIAPLSSWLAEGLRDGDLYWLSYYASRILMGLCWLIIGAVLLFTARPIARLLVSMRQDSDCPACRYPIWGAGTTRCPECGLRLPSGFGAPSDEESLQTKHRRLLERAANTRILIPLAIVGIVVTTLCMVAGMFYGFIALFMDDGGLGIFLASTLVGAAVNAAFVWMIFWSFRARRTAVDSTAAIQSTQASPDGSQAHTVTAPRDT